MMNPDYSILGTKQAVTYLLSMEAPQQPSKIRRAIAAEIERELLALDFSASPESPFYAQFQAIKAWSRGDWRMAAQERAGEVLGRLITLENSLTGTNGAMCLNPRGAIQLHSTLSAAERA